PWPLLLAREKQTGKTPGSATAREAPQAGEAPGEGGWHFPGIECPSETDPLLRGCTPASPCDALGFDCRRRIRICCDELNLLVPFCNAETDKATTLQWTTAFLKYIQERHGDSLKKVSM
uniref:BHLH domain-containing protein n=1 Tax=Equus asinus TaxID=9793 RepID=A0A9L0JZ40_EQUAS